MALCRRCRVARRGARRSALESGDRGVVQTVSYGATECTTPVGGVSTFCRAVHMVSCAATECTPSARGWREGPASKLSGVLNSVPRSVKNAHMVGNPRSIDVYAARQYGVFNTRQIREAGFDKSAVLRRCSSGEWIRLCPNVFAVASAPPKWERSLAAAVLSRPKAIVAGLAAAYLHGIRGGVRGRPVIVVPASANARSPISRVIRHANFSLIDTVMISGFITTSVAETLVLLGRDLPRPKIEAAFDDALIVGKLKLGALDRILVRESASCARGMATIRELADARSSAAPTIAGSYLERMTELLFRRGNLVGWSREFPFSIRGSGSRVDFFFSDSGVVVEADSRSWHMRAADFESDRQRDNELMARGYVVLRFTYQMLDQEPERCLETLSQVLSERRAPSIDARHRTHSLAL